MDNDVSERFYFIANNLALDFVNTLIVDEKDEPFELLKSVDDLFDWAAAAGAIDQSRAESLRKKLNTEQRKKLFNQALAFRSELKKMAKAVADGKRVPASTIEVLNEVLSRSSGYFKLISTPDGFETTFQIDHRTDVDLLMPIAESVARLLTDGDLNMVRKCQRSACVLYFYDNSKRHGRRWCSMSACGNRAKAAAHYHRNHQKPGQSA
jgi:predicted RNA-binding Zn ribbon-like protein